MLQTLLGFENSRADAISKCDSKVLRIFPFGDHEE